MTATTAETIDWVTLGQDFAGPLTFGADASAVEVDVERRIIRGLVLPFNVIGNNGKGKYLFTAAAVPLPADPTRVKLLIAHNHGEAVGHATSFDARNDGIWGEFKVDTSPEGDRALLKASEKTWDGLSAGIDPRKGRFRLQGDVFHAIEAPFWEVSLTPLPAFDDARVTSVAASAAQNRKEPVVGDTITEPVVEAPTFSAADGAALMEKVEALAVDLAAMKEIQIPVGPGPQLQVTEEPIYRFAGSEPAPSGFDFATDLLAAARGSEAALDRIKTFTAAEAKDGPTFVTTANTSQVNPSQYRADMFLGQAPTPASPLYDTFHKGSLSNLTPFFWAKLDRAATTVGVGDHTEGTDPAATNLVTASGATVTPIPISGKVHITREVADQGGNPRVSGLIKAEFDRSFAIARENKTAALIQAAMGSIASLTAAIAAGAAGVVAGRAIEAGLVGLQFLADGSRFTKLFGHVDLYTALSQATIPGFTGDTVGTKAYPIINPQNRDGVQGSKYAFIDIAGYRMEPAWSLGATSANPSNSLAADPNAVHVWNSGLTSLDKLQEKVEGWDVGVFAYWAGVVYDVTGLRKISYDPVP